MVLGKYERMRGVVPPPTSHPTAPTELEFYGTGTLEKLKIDKIEF
jgi:hypothetical protein